MHGNPTENCSIPCEEIEALIRKGLYMDAWQLASKCELPLEKWPDGDAMKHASTLASSLGNDRLGYLLDYRNWRFDRSCPDRYFQAIFSRLRIKRPFELIPEVENFLKSSKDVSPLDMSNMQAFLGWAYATTHDFDVAMRWSKQSLATHPDHSWAHVQLSHIYQLMDDYPAALAAASHALTLRPVYRPAVSQLAHMMLISGRDADAMQLLHEKHKIAQNAAFVIQLQEIYSEQDNHNMALWCLDEAEKLLPLMSDDYRKWMNARRADFHYLAGDFKTFVNFASKQEKGFQKKMLENFQREGADQRARKRLDVPFIRQHNMTCAPATLASLARYWGREIDHLEIAASICYDGTPWEKERQWAVNHGFAVREFRLDRDILVALIDRDIPFTLTTEATTSAHLQACIGYDMRTDVIFIRDPTHRHYVEMMIQPLLDEHPVEGPRCLVLIPKEWESRLHGLHFPAQAAYDAYHDFHLALATHDPLQMRAALALMRTVATDSPLYLKASGQFHSYERNSRAEWLACRELRQRFPEHQPLMLQELYLLRQINDQKSALKLVLDVVEKDKCDPVFYSECGEMLLADARQLDHAERLLVKCLRRMSSSGRSYESLARCRTKQGRIAEAVRLRRAATCLAVSNEGYARAYADTCRRAGDTATGLDFLGSRARQCGSKDSGPWITWCNALGDYGREDEAKKILHEARALIPSCGLLKLAGAKLMMFWGDDARKEAESWLFQARGSVPENDWLREAAFFKANTGERRNAIEYWQSLLKRESTAWDAYRYLAPLIAEEEGEQAAWSFLENACEKHPDSWPLWTILVEWKSNAPPEELERLLNRLIELNPDSDWALRERSLLHLNADRYDQSLADAMESLQKAPHRPESHGILSMVLRKKGDTEAANEALRKATQTDIDYDWAARSLLSHASSPELQREALAFVHQEMMAQVSDGSIVIEYQRLAYPIIEKLTHLEQLREFSRLKPDLWQTWVARKQQAVATALWTEAQECVDQLKKDFPLLPRTWIEDADFHRIRGEHEKEFESLCEACHLSPGWAWAATQLATVAERLGKYPDAEDALQRALRHDPLSASNHLHLIAFLQRTDREEEAIKRAIQCVRQVPLSTDAWSKFTELAIDAKRNDLVVKELQSIGDDRHHDARWHTVVANTYHQLDDTDAAIEACRKGLVIKPNDHDLHDLLAFLYVFDRQFDQARNACIDATTGQPLSRELEGRLCWVILRSGNEQEAINKMKKLLERYPDYEWIISQLASLQSSNAQWKDLRDTARRWLGVDSRETRAYGYLGQAEREMNNVAQAKEAFSRAAALDPHYLYVWRQLLEIHIHQREYDQAEVVLQHLLHESPDSATACDAIDLALARKDVNQAMSHLDKLASFEDSASRQWHWVKDMYYKKGEKTRFDTWLTEYINHATSLTGGIAAFWIETMAQNGKQAVCVKRIEDVKLSPAAWEQAWVAWIEACDSPKYLNLLKKQLSVYGDKWKANAKTRDAVGYSFCNTVEYGLAAQWFGDNYDDDEATDVTAFNAHHAFAATGNWDKAVKALRFLIHDFPASNLAKRLQPVNALSHFIEGNADAGRADLAAVNKEEQNLNVMIAHSLAKSIDAVERDLFQAKLHFRNAHSTLNSTKADKRVADTYFRQAENHLVTLVPKARGKRWLLRLYWIPQYLTYLWVVVGLFAYVALKIIIKQID